MVGGLPSEDGVASQRRRRARLSVDVLLGQPILHFSPRFAIVRHGLPRHDPVFRFVPFGGGPSDGLLLYALRPYHADGRAVGDDTIDRPSHVVRFRHHRPSTARRLFEVGLDRLGQRNHVLDLRFGPGRLAGPSVLADSSPAYRPGGQHDLHPQRLLVRRPFRGGSRLDLRRHGLHPDRRSLVVGGSTGHRRQREFHRHCHSSGGRSDREVPTTPEHHGPWDRLTRSGHRRREVELDILPPVVVRLGGVGSDFDDPRHPRRPHGRVERVDSTIVVQICRCRCRYQ